MKYIFPEANLSHAVVAQWSGGQVFYCLGGGGFLSSPPTSSNSEYSNKTEIQAVSFCPEDKFSAQI